MLLLVGMSWSAASVSDDTDIDTLTLNEVGSKLACGGGVGIGEKIESGFIAVPCGVEDEGTLGGEEILGSGSLVESLLSSTIFKGTDCDILPVFLTYSRGIKMNLKQKSV